MQSSWIIPKSFPPPTTMFCGKTVLHDTGPWCQKRLGPLPYTIYKNQFQVDCREFPGSPVIGAPSFHGPGIEAPASQAAKQTNKKTK